MSSIILPRRFYSQPQGLVEVDWNNPLAADLTMAWTPRMASTGQHKQIVVGTPSTSAAIAETGSAFGIAQNHGQNGLQLPGSFTPADPPGISALVIGGRPPTGQSWSIACLSPYGAFRKWSNEYTIHSKFGGGYTRIATATQWPVDPAVVVAGRAGGGGAPTATRFLVNGVNAANTTTNSASTYGPTTYEVMQGTAGDRSAATYWAAPTALILQWARYLSDDAAQELTRNPWQIFRAQPRVLYFDAAVAVTGQEVTLSEGSVSAEVTAPLSGQEVTVSVGDVGIGGDIVRALTGQVVTLSQGSVGVLAANDSGVDTHDGWLQPVKRRKPSKEVRNELERLFRKAEVVAEKVAEVEAPKPASKPSAARKTQDIGLPPIAELQGLLMHLRLIQDEMTGQQLERLVELQQQMDFARMYNIRARAALLAA